MLTIRDVVQSDAPAIHALLDQLGWSAHIRQYVTVDYISRYLAFPYNNILLAGIPSEPHLEGGAHLERSKPVTTGLLAYSTRPDLFHGGQAALIENFVVDQAFRRQGIGSALLNHLIERLTRSGCVAVCVDIEPDNHQAIRFYQRHGLDNQVMLLERHL